jgi:hypothetical protein
LEVTVAGGEQLAAQFSIGGGPIGSSGLTLLAALLTLSDAVVVPRNDT